MAAEQESVTAERPQAPHAGVTSRHYRGLDGLRGLAVLSVLGMHFTLHAPVILASSDTLGARIIIDAAKAGWIGVDLFFVLSGFLITGILYDAKGSSDYFRNFYVRRILRIFPLYFVTLLFVLEVLPHVSPTSIRHAKDFETSKIWLWTYLTNWRIGYVGDWSAAPGTGHFWSLAVEEQFYLAWPWVVFMLGRRALLRLCAGIMVAVLIIRCIAYLHGVSPVTVYVLTVTRMDTLSAGAAAALLVRGDALGPSMRRKVKLVVIGAVAIIAAIIATSGTIGETDWAVDTFGFSALAIAFVAFMLMSMMAGEGTLLSAIVNGRVLRYVGLRSYALYVLHPFVTVFVTRVVERHPAFMVQGGPFLRQAELWIGEFAVSILIAEASWHVIERRFLALKRYFPRSSPPTGAVRSPVVA